MKIWLDAGHGGKDPGTTAFGVLEKNWTLDIDKRIAKILSHNGIEYERTRESDVYVSPDIRAAKVRNSGAKYCISSHINAGGGKGAETIHSISSQKGKQLAQLILEELGKIGLDTRRAYSKKGSQGDYYYMHRLTGAVTTIIVEYGFIDNKVDHNFLSQGVNRQRAAEAVVKAIFRLEGINYVPLQEEEVNDDGEDTLLNIGDQGEKVEELQKNLMKLGYSLERYKADGIFGKETREAVMAFQKDHNLKVDGIVGPETERKIQELLGDMSGENIYRVIVDGKQVGAYRMHENIIKQVEKHLESANSIRIEKIR